MRAPDEPLLERDAPLALLCAAAARACRGHGGVVAMTAVAGMGKTSLLRSLVPALLAEHGASLRVLRSTGRELERDFPFGTVRALIEPALAAADVRREVLAGAAAPVGAWFGPPVEEFQPVQPLTMLRALYWTVAGLAERTPLVLIIDDAHDADDSSLAFMSHLAQGIADLPVLLVLAARPDGWNERPSLVALTGDLQDRIELAPLSESATADLTRRRLATQPDDEFVAACRRLSGGNPFYLGELLREVCVVGAEPTAANAGWVADLGVPALVRGSLLRAATLPAGTLDVLRAAAVLGDGTALVTVAAVAEVSVADAGRIADRLADAGILAPGTDIAFAHGLLRTAVLADLRAHERAAHYRRAAVVLASSHAPDHEVAQHLLRSEPGGEDWAADLMRREGLSLLAGGSTTSAVELLRGALAERGGTDDAELLAGLGLALSRAGDPAGAPHLARAIELTADPDLRTRRALHLAHLLANSGNSTAAVQTLEVAIALQPPGTELLLFARTLRFLYQRYAPTLHARAISERPELLELARGPLTPGRAALRATLASDASHHRPRTEAVALIAPAIDLLPTVAALDTQLVWVAFEAMLTLEMDDEFDALVDVVSEGALARGAAIDLVACTHFRALAAHLRGLPRDAEDEAVGSLASGAWAGWPVGAAASYAVASMACLALGRSEEAVAHQVRAAEVSIGSGKPASMVLLAHGRLALADGDPVTAVRDSVAGGELLRPTDSHAPGLLDWGADVVDARIAAGDLVGAETAAVEQLQLARTVAGPRALARALRCVGVVRGDEAALTEALALLDGPVRGLERARVLFELGALQRRSGRPTVARGHLDEAWDLSQRLGATRLGERIRDELKVAGARPRRAFVRGPGSLTASEGRVARLAADGRSNTEIAQQLFVTTKTVEKHLGAAYRKLEIATRAELATALG